VKVELLSEWGQPIHAELSHERQHVLRLKAGDAACISTKAMKIFCGQKSIAPGHRIADAARD